MDLWAVEQNLRDFFRYLESEELDQKSKKNNRGISGLVMLGLLGIGYFKVVLELAGSTILAKECSDSMSQPIGWIGLSRRVLLQVEGQLS